MHWSYVILALIHSLALTYGLVQERRNSIANALELRHSRTNLSISTLLSVRRITSSSAKLMESVKNVTRDSSPKMLEKPVLVGKNKVL